MARNTFRTVPTVRLPAPRQHLLTHPQPPHRHVITTTAASWRSPGWQRGTAASAGPGSVPCLGGIAECSRSCPASGTSLCRLATVPTPAHALSLFPFVLAALLCFGRACTRRRQRQHHHQQNTRRCPCDAERVPCVRLPGRTAVHAGRPADGPRTRLCRPCPARGGAQAGDPPAARPRPTT